MVNDRSSIDAYWRLAIWCLRLSISFQCLGIAGRYLLAKFETESPVYGVLYFESEFHESTAQLIDDLGVYGCLIAGVAILVTGFYSAYSRSTHSDRAEQRLVLIETLILSGVFIWILSMGIGQTIRGDLFARITLLEIAVRLATPVTLIIFLRLKNLNVKNYLFDAGLIILLLATSTTFAVHGYKAIELYGTFLDYLLLSQPLGFPLVTNQQTAETLLWVIGWIDIGLAVALVALRWQGVALYMAAWGLLTAISRVTASGLEAWPEVLIRAANAGAPLTLFFLFRMKSFSKDTIK